MHQYFATVYWQRNGAKFIDNQYSRAHRWLFDGGLEIPASASPLIVAQPQSLAQNIDPEEAFIASLSSCHMLFFLSFAAKAKIVIDSYEDNAFAVMDECSGKTLITKVVLRPKVTFNSNLGAVTTQLDRLHHLAHEHCFIANSVKSDVSVEPTYEPT